MTDRLRACFIEKRLNEIKQAIIIQMGANRKVDSESVYAMN